MTGIMPAQKTAPRKSERRSVMALMMSRGFTVRRISKTGGRTRIIIAPAACATRRQQAGCHNQNRFTLQRPVARPSTKARTSQTSLWTQKVLKARFRIFQAAIAMTWRSGVSSRRKPRSGVMLRITRHQAFTLMQWSMRRGFMSMRTMRGHSRNFPRALTFGATLQTGKWAIG